MLEFTCDAAEQTQAGCRVAPVAAGMSLCRSRWHRDCHGDRLVELSPPRLHSDDGAKGGSVPKDCSHHVIWHRLGLYTNTRTPGEETQCLFTDQTLRNVQTFPELSLK